MAGRPPKQLTLVKGHLTNAQKDARDKAEKALVTSYVMKPWAKTKQNETAMKQFKKIKKAFAKIGQDDICFESVLNRYCIIFAECDETEKTREAILAGMRDMLANKDEIVARSDVATFYTNLVEMAGKANDCDRTLAKKREMMLSIERENIMTVNAKLRAVPKKATEEEPDEMTKLLAGGRPR